jgi:DNA-binding transcriptional ArsR family regulator
MAAQSPPPTPSSSRLLRDREGAEIFRALGDPVRLEMVRRLTQSRPSTISVVSKGLGISRQGARKHLQVLVDAKLVALAQKGRDVMVQLDAATLEKAKAFIAELELRWGERLYALKRYVEAPARKKSKKRATLLHKGKR